MGKRSAGAGDIVILVKEFFFFCKNEKQRKWKQEKRKEKKTDSQHLGPLAVVEPLELLARPKSYGHGLSCRGPLIAWALFLTSKIRTVSPTRLPRV